MLTLPAAPSPAPSPRFSEGLRILSNPHAYADDVRAVGILPTQTAAR